MSITKHKSKVIYPESDGMPVGETDLHIDWTFRLRDMLKTRYRGKRTYVAADLLVYYEEGVPWNFVVPDVFAVNDCDTHFRRVYKIWEEPSPPQAVIEVTSKSTRRQDEVLKPRVYADIGVAEYFLYDPTADYLDPPLQGHRRTESGFDRIEPTSDGILHCETLGIDMSLAGQDLILRDATTKEILLTAAGEAEQRAGEAEQRAGEAEQRAGEAAQRAEDAERRIAEADRRNFELEAELERLRERLGE